VLLQAEYFRRGELFGAAGKPIRVGCCGWYYWHWKGTIYPDSIAQAKWFEHYQRTHDTVELNAPFYHWPKLATARNWARQAKQRFKYSIKVNQLITHEKRFTGTRTLIREFYQFAEILEGKMGCFLFQLPPSFKYSYARLRSILTQLDPVYRNVVEFRHASWWNESVFEAFQEAGIIFCSVSAPRLPDKILNTAGSIYVRFHGPKRWYRHDFSRAELWEWTERIKASGAREIWAYFNNDREGYAFRNARLLKRLLRKGKEKS